MYLTKLYPLVYLAGFKKTETIVFVTIYRHNIASTVVSLANVCY